jgi:choline kinase
MVPLCGRPLLAYQLDTLRAAGVDDVVLVGGYRRDELPTEGVRHAVNEDFDKTNMVWSLFCAENELNSDVLITYSDIVYHPDIVRALLQSSHDMAITVDVDWQKLWQLRMHDPLQDAESMVLDTAGRVLELGQKPTSYKSIQAQYMGLIKLSAAAVPKVRKHYHALDRAARYEGRDFPNMFMTSFLQGLIDAGHEVYSVPVHGGWLEVDTLEDLAIYEKQGLTALGVV